MELINSFPTALYLTAQQSFEYYILFVEGIIDDVSLGINKHGIFFIEFNVSCHKHTVRITLIYELQLHNIELI